MTEELARFIWPDATPEEIRILAEALRKGFDHSKKLKETTACHQNKMLAIHE